MKVLRHRSVSPTAGKPPEGRHRPPVCGEPEALKNFGVDVLAGSATNSLDGKSRRTRRLDAGARPMPCLPVLLEHKEVLQLEARVRTPRVLAETSDQLAVERTSREESRGVGHPHRPRPAAGVWATSAATAASSVAAAEIDESPMHSFYQPPTKVGLRDTRETMIQAIRPPGTCCARRISIDARYRDAARRAGARARRASLAGALQPRVPQGVRRDAAPVPAHAAARARRGAAPNTDRTVSEICSPVGPAERRVVHVELRTRVRAARRPPTGPPIHRPQTASGSRRACCSPTAGRSRAGLEKTAG